MDPLGIINPEQVINNHTLNPICFLFSLLTTSASFDLVHFLNYLMCVSDLFPWVHVNLEGSEFRESEADLTAKG